MKRISQEEMTRKLAPYLYAEWLLLGSVFVLVFGLLLYWVFTEAISPFEFAGYAATGNPRVATVLLLVRTPRGTFTK